MKYLLSVLLVATALSSSYAQAQYEVIEKSGRKILKGIISRDILEKDTSIKWFRQQQEGYVPDAAIVSTLASKADEVQYLVFAGTWCGDTRFLLPKFYSLLDAAGIAGNRVSLVAVDYSKKTIGHLSEAFNIQRVPTFIVLKNGKETGRVVEYGTTGKWDKELSEIVVGKNNL